MHGLMREGRREPVLYSTLSLVWFLLPRATSALEAVVMNGIERVLVGVVLFTITSIVAYLFRMRQLYIVSAKLFRHAPISKSGSLCELIIYNKGNQVEEEIQVELDPEISAELLASSSGDITLEGSIMKIERLHKGSEASAMLLIENVVFERSRIMAFSSKATKGKVLKKISDVPPNLAKAFLFTVMYVGVLPAGYYGIQLYEELSARYVGFRLEDVSKRGWSGLSKYYDSQIRHSYGDQEFPVRFIRREAGEHGEAKLLFEVYNKLAVPMRVTADRADSPAGDVEYFEKIDVPPMSKHGFSVSEPRPDQISDKSELEFSFKAEEDFVYGVRFSIPRI
jgi:hypothetical protein